MKKEKFSTILFVSLMTFIHGLVQDESLITSVIGELSRGRKSIENKNNSRLIQTNANGID